MDDKELGNLLLAEFDDIHLTDDDDRNNETSISLAHIVFITFTWVQGLGSNWNYRYIYNKEHFY